MANPKHRRSHSAVGRNRAHLALKKITPKVCPQCGGPVLSHKVCKACGYYNGKQVIKTKSDIKVKREEKRKIREKKEKEKMQKLKN